MKRFRPLIPVNVRFVLCSRIIHFVPVCGSLSRYTFRALHGTAENIGIRGGPHVTNELVDGLKRLIVLRKLINNIDVPIG